MADFATLVLQLKTAGFNANLQKASSKLTNFSKGITGVGIALSAVAVPLALFGKNAIQAASDAEEISSKFNAVFKDVRIESDKTAKTLSKNFGIADSTAKELLSTTGDLLSGFGFTGKQALDLSNKVNRLAIDLASFSNYAGGAKGAGQALTKALLGETESAKSLGIVIRQNTKEFRNQVKILMETRNLTETQAKAILILDQAYAQSKNAIGDYARTQDSTANSMRRLSERFKDLRETIGVMLIKTLKIGKVLSFIGEKINSLNKYIASLSPLTKKIIALTGLLIIGLATLTIGLGALSFAIANIITLIGILSPLIVSLTVNILSLIGTLVPVLLPAILIIGTAIAGWKIGEKIAEITGLKDAISDLASEMLGYNEIIEANLRLQGKLDEQINSINLIRARVGRLDNEQLLERKKILENIVSSGKKTLAITNELKIINNRIKNQGSGITTSNSTVIAEKNIKLIEAEKRFQEIISNIEFNRASNQEKLNILNAQRLDLINKTFSTIDKIQQLDLKGKISIISDKIKSIKDSMQDTFSSAKSRFMERLERFSFNRLSVEEKINVLTAKRNKLLQQSAMVTGESRFDLLTRALEIAEQLESLKVGDKTGEITRGQDNFVQAALAGTVEAQRQAIGQTVDVNKQTADNTKELVNINREQLTVSRKIANNQPVTLSMAGA